MNTFAYKSYLSLFNFDFVTDFLFQCFIIYFFSKMLWTCSQVWTKLQNGEIVAGVAVYYVNLKLNWWEKWFLLLLEVIWIFVCAPFLTLDEFLMSSVLWSYQYDHSNMTIFVDNQLWEMIEALTFVQMFLKQK